MVCWCGRKENNQHNKGKTKYSSKTERRFKNNNNNKNLESKSDHVCETLFALVSTDKDNLLVELSK